jgi:hypothetical protein
MKTSSWRYFTRIAGRFNGLFRQEKATVKTVVKTTGVFGRPAGKPKTGVRWAPHRKKGFTRLQSRVWIETPSPT